MKIGIAGPISLELLNVNLEDSEIPSGLMKFPMIAFIVNSLMENGHELVIYTCATNIKAPIVIKKDKVTICICHRKPSPGRRFFREEIMGLYELMLKHPVDIINAQWSYEYAIAALKTKIPTVITVRDHASTILKYKFDAFRFVRWLLNIRVFKKGKYFIANSHYLKDLIERKGKVVEVISNFYDERLETRYQHTKLNTNTIVSVANGFKGRKNIKSALKAFKVLKSRFPSLTLELIGHQMEYRGSAYWYAKKKGLENGVAFSGPLPFDKVIKKISEATVLLHPSKEETFGNTILEAMVLGTPVVAGEKSGNVPYLLNFGRCGILCDINSPSMIAKATAEVFENGNLYEALRKEARQFAIEHYSKQHVVSQLVKYYNEVLGKPTS